MQYKHRLETGFYMWQDCNIKDILLKINSSYVTKFMLGVVGEQRKEEALKIP